MKYLFYLLPVFIFVPCTKESTGNDNLISKITVSGKLSESFTYNNDGMITAHNSYGECAPNVMDETVYSYENKRLATIGIKTRSLYSSTAAMCNPASGISSSISVGYNSAGKITRLTRDHSESLLIYNANGYIEKVEIRDSVNSIFYQFIYNSKGNIIRQIDPYGNVTNYEYDNKINPFYKIKYQLHIITAFNNSPNNVIKATGAASFTRNFTYNAAGLPVKVLETNGLVYDFEYQ